MPRISNNTFKVNDALEQVIELGAIASGVSIPVSIDTSNALNTNLLSVNGSTLNLGNNNQTGSLPVTIASDDVLTCNIANFNANNLNVNSNIAYVSGSPLTLGQKNATSSVPVVLASDVMPSVSSNIAYVDDTAKTNNSTTDKAFQVGMYGWDGSNWSRVNTSGSGNLKAEIMLEYHNGSQGNLSSNQSHVADDVTLTINPITSTLITVMGNTTDTSNGVIPQASADDMNWYNMDFEMFPQPNGDLFGNIEATAVNYFRMKFQGTGTTTLTALFNNH